MARRLRTSRRTLQRRLHEAVISFAALIEQTRLETALRLLAEPQLSIAQASIALGFSEQSAFQRVSSIGQYVSWEMATKLPGRLGLGLMVVRTIPAVDAS